MAYLERSLLGHLPRVVPSVEAALLVFRQALSPLLSGNLRRLGGWLGGWRSPLAEPARG